MTAGRKINLLAAFALMAAQFFVLAVRAQAQDDSDREKQSAAGEAKPKDPEQEQRKEALDRFRKDNKDLLEKSSYFSALDKGGLLDKADISAGPPPIIRFPVEVDGKQARMMLILGVPPQPEMLLIIKDGGSSSAVAPWKPGGDPAAGLQEAVRESWSQDGTPGYSQGVGQDEVSGTSTGEPREQALDSAQNIAARLGGAPSDDALSAGGAGSGDVDPAGPKDDPSGLPAADDAASPASPGAAGVVPAVIDGPDGLARQQAVLASDVPGVAGAGKKAAEGAPLISREIKESFWAAAGKFAPSLAAERIRDLKQGAAADARSAWLSAKRAALLSQAGNTSDPAAKARMLKAAAGVDRLLAARASAAALTDPAARAAALGEWGAGVSGLMENSAEGSSERSLLDARAGMEAAYAGLKTDADRSAWLRMHKSGYDAAGRKLADLYAANPEYLAAKKAEADARLFMRSSLEKFRDGTAFTAGELGLQLPAGTKLLISRSPENSASGARGVAYKDEKGYAHFQSFDDQVRVDEVPGPDGGRLSVEHRLAADGTLNMAERQAGGALLRTEERRPDGTVLSERYGGGGAPVFSVLRRPDGTSVEAEMLAGGAFKRTVNRDASGGGTFTVESASGEGGYPRQSGRVVAGRLVTDRIETAPGETTERTGPYLFEKRSAGKPTGTYEVDMPAIQALPGSERRAAAVSAAVMLTGGKPEKSAPLTRFITNVLGQAEAGDQVSLIAGKDAAGAPVYQAELLNGEGYRRQVVGQWTKLSRAERSGLRSDVGLDVSVRSGSPADDFAKMQYLKLFRYSGADITDRYGSSSRLTGNWFVGYGVKEDSYVHRYVGGSERAQKKIYTGTQSLYSSPSILGQTGIAVGKMGKGTVQLTASAFAVVGAGTVGWADGNLQDELLARAKSNFYGNEVSRDLGRNYLGSYYREGYERLNVDEIRNIQSVGREMAGMGQPTLGAVLQGGVEFSNGVATSLILAPVGGRGLTKGLEKLGTAGSTAGKGLGAYRSVKYAYDSGASGVEFARAYRAFDENDPVSRQRYYDAVTNLTTQALYAPATVSGLMKTADNARQLKGALTSRPSVILGADGRPYQRPPAELGSFSKFMLGKTEPGFITKAMTSDITGGLDPALRMNLANNPASRAVGRLDKWIATQTDRIAGRPVDIPRPALILPGQAQPVRGPAAKIIIPGQPEPGPAAKIIVPGQPDSSPGGKLLLP